jgi:hypothetical protein
MRIAIALAALLILPLSATAQTSAPATTAPAAAAPNPNAPKPPCTRADEYPGKLASDQAKRNWQRDFSAYVECMKKFIEDQKTQGDLHYEAARGAIAAVNKDIADANEARKTD